MFSFDLKSSVAAVALAAVMAVPMVSLAQDAAPEAPAAAQTAAPVALPSALSVDGLSDVTQTRGKYGVRVQGKLPDGQDFTAGLDAQGALRMIRTEGVLPQAMLDAALPDTVRQAPMLAQVAQVKGLMLSDQRGSMVMGQDSDGQPVMAAFSAQGELMRFARGDDAMPRMDRGPRGDRDNDRGFAPRGDGQKMQGRRGGDCNGPKMGSKPGRDNAQQRPARAGRAAPVDEAAVRSATEAAGYTDLGAITQDGPNSFVEANNPQGEAVTVAVGPNGRVLGETAR